MADLVKIPSDIIYTAEKMTAYNFENMLLGIRYTIRGYFIIGLREDETGRNFNIRPLLAGNPPQRHRKTIITL